jgi:SAM-dependent methyltransferase
MPSSVVRRAEGTSRAHPGIRLHISRLGMVAVGLRGAGCCALCVHHAKAAQGVRSCSQSARPRAAVSIVHSLFRGLKYAAYVARGKKPFTTGYGVYREWRIVAMFARCDFDEACRRPGYGVRLDERVVEYPWLFSRLPAHPGKVLDAGSVLNFDYILAHPSLTTKQIFISTLAPEAAWQRVRQNVSYVYEDLRQTCFRDEYFDWIVSVSTLEHVGLDNTMFYTADRSKREQSPHDHLRVVRELRRVLKPRGTVYASVPFGRHENHGWLQVFDAAMVDRLLESFAPSSYVERHFRYDLDGWRTSSREESRDATYFDHHNSRTRGNEQAAAGAVVCLELVK